MAAPDYVSQVRGVINDLRQDYAQKQQLFQQQQQANANLALNYAQLEANRENAAINRDLQNRQLEFNFLQEANRSQQAKDKLAADAKVQQYNVYKDQLNQDLAERKYNLDTYKEIRSANKEAVDAMGKKQANERLAEFARLAAAKDYAGMRNWYTEAQKDTAETLEYGAMINQASQIASGIEKTSNLQTVEMVRPEIESFSRDAGSLTSSMQNYSTADRAQRISELKTRGTDLLTVVKDPDMRDTINVVLNGIDLREKQIVEEKSRNALNEFDFLGADKRLAEVDPTIQQKFDDLYASTPKEERGTEDFNLQRRRLMLDFNRKKSDSRVKRAALELASYEAAQLENPDYTVTNEDGSVSPKYPAPDLALSFATGTLDRDNNISEGLLTEIEKFRQQMRTAGVAKFRENEMASALSTFMDIRSGKPTVKPSGTQAPQAQGKVRRLSNIALLPAPTPSPTEEAAPAQPTQPGTMAGATTTQAPSANINDLQANRTLLAEVQKQLAEGKRYLEIVNPQTGEVKISQISLATLNASLPGLIRSLEQTSALAGAQEEQR